jgi:hypothetical protein
MLLDESEYRRELEQIAERITPFAEAVNIRGDGAAQFIFAVSKERSLEISRSDEGIWIEFWREDNESLTRELTIQTHDEAVAAASEWMKQK